MSPTHERIELLDWFKLVWRDTEGAVRLAYQTSELDWKNVMFSWPIAADAIVDWVMAKTGTGSEVFYAPAIFKDRSSGQSYNVKGSWCCWVDFDGNGPDEWSEVAGETPEPSVRVQSSLPGNQHCYWMLDEFITKEELEGKNRVLAYDLQADTSGWDASQVLRPPTTSNYGYTKPDRGGKVYSVELVDMSKAVYAPDFIQVPKYFVDVIKNAIDVHNLPGVPLVLSKGSFPERFVESFFGEVPDKGVRSDALMELGYLSAEAGLSDTEIYALVDDADKRWGKYVNRTADRRFNILSDIVERARLKHPHGGENLVALFKSGRTGEVEKPQQIVFTHREFLNAEVTFEWDFENLLTRGGFGIFAGEPGVGKTQIFNQFARASAAGKDFLVWKNSGQPRRVLYLSLEMPFAGLQKFLKMSDTGDEAETRLIDENLLIAPLSTTLPLDTDQGKKFLVDLTQQYSPEIVIVDSLAKSTHVALTDEVAMRRLNDFIQEYRQRFSASFAFVHHTKKAQIKQKLSESNPIDDMYGARFLSGDLDFLVSMAKSKPKGTIYTKHGKSRYGLEHDDFTMVRNEDLSFTVTNIHSDGDSPEDNLIAKFARGQNSSRGHGSGAAKTEYGFGWAKDSD